MRYDAGRRARTRQKILDSAGRRFRQDGIAGTGLASVMADAGLTIGAFSAHFPKKEDLLVELLATTLETQAQSIKGRSLDDVIRAYLTPAHRDAPDVGCINATLVSELSRQPEAVRKRYSDGLARVIDQVAALVVSGDDVQRRRTAWSVFAHVIGVLQLSRAIADDTLSHQILEDGVRTALQLAAAPRAEA